MESKNSAYPKSTPIGVFPSPTLSQLEKILDERQSTDRRKTKIAIDFRERRQQERRKPSE